MWPPVHQRMAFPGWFALPGSKQNSVQDQVPFFRLDRVIVEQKKKVLDYFILLFGSSRQNDVIFNGAFQSI